MAPGCVQLTQLLKTSPLARTNEPTDWYLIHYPKHSLSPSLKHSDAPSTTFAAVTSQVCSDSTSQTHSLHCLIDQCQQVQGNTATCRFHFDSHIILTWNYVAAPSSSLGLNSGVHSLWDYSNQKGSSSSRWWFTPTFSRVIVDGK